MFQKMMAKLLMFIMNKALRDIVAIVLVMLPHILKAEDDHGEKEGATKKSVVSEKVVAIIRQPGGIDLPEVVLDHIVPFLVDLLVDWLNGLVDGKNSESGSEA
jgi:hypothetical protein